MKRLFVWLGVIFASISIISSDRGSSLLNLELHGDDSLQSNLKRLVRRSIVDSGSGDVADEPKISAGSGDVVGSGDDKDGKITGPDDDTEVSGDSSGDGTSEPDSEKGESSGDREGSATGQATKSPVVLKTEKLAKPSTGKDTRVEDINTTGAAATKSTASPAATDKQSTKRVETAPPSQKATDWNNVIPTFERKTSENDIGGELGAMKEVNQKDNETPSENKKSGGKMNFTIGIAIGVGIGAVLAVTIILFLIYRVRKKDSGSYMLDEQSSQKSMLGHEDYKGKEYFA